MPKDSYFTEVAIDAKQLAKSYKGVSIISIRPSSKGRVISNTKQQNITYADLLTKIFTYTHICQGQCLA
ncbi:hypothetical protein CBF18_11605 [Mastigocladus laminosus WC112]|nr:hypothetical protein CBF18_11605 [Mastigocladus laminosus WC112]